jgi:hypothetical protein
MKKFLFLTAMMVLHLYGAVTLPIISVDEKHHTLEIKAPQKVEVGMSGFAIHHINENHSSILKNCVVTKYDEQNKTATLQTSPFSALKNNALPSGKWKLQVGDSVELAFGYTRGVLIAPSEEVYHRITKAVKLEWVHPDIFATILSFTGHPTPLKSDFKLLSDSLSVGLIFIFLDKQLYTVDAKSFKILAISPAAFEVKKEKLPFYTRVTKIEANWFGEGSDEMQSYAPHYYELLERSNKENLQLQQIIKNLKNRTK